MPDSIVVPLQPGYDEVFTSRVGLVGRDMWRRGLVVLEAAKRDVGVRSGNLRTSLGMSWIVDVGISELGIRVGSETAYALMHHEGTRAHVIKPKNARVLRWVNSSGEICFARSVFHPGTHPNHYLADNLPLAVV